MENTGLEDKLHSSLTSLTSWWLAGLCRAYNYANTGLEDKENTQDKYNSEKASNAKYNKSKLPWFSCLI